MGQGERDRVTQVTRQLVVTYGSVPNVYLCLYVDRLHHNLPSMTSLCQHLRLYVDRLLACLRLQEPVEGGGWDSSEADL